MLGRGKHRFLGREGVIWFGGLEKVGGNWERRTEKEVEEWRLYDSVHTCFSKASGMGGMGWVGIKCFWNLGVGGWGWMDRTA